MNKENFEYVNQFKFKNAKVIGKRPRGSSYVITLFARINGKAVYPRIICRNNISNIQDIEINSFLNGRGFIRAYTEIAADKSAKKHQYFVADEISISQDLMSEIFGRKGNYFGESRFEIILSGKARSITDVGKYSYITVETDVCVEGRKPSYVTVTKPSNVPCPRKDDMIALAVSLTTPKLKKSGQTAYLENLFVSDLVIV